MGRAGVGRAGVVRAGVERAGVVRVGAEAHARHGAAGGVARRHVGVGVAGQAGQAVGRGGVGGRAAARRARLLVVLLQAGPELRRRQLQPEVRRPLDLVLLLRLLSVEVSR